MTKEILITFGREAKVFYFDVFISPESLYNRQRLFISEISFIKLVFNELMYVNLELVIRRLVDTEGWRYSAKEL